MERRIREVNRFTVGWTAYFAYADTPRPFPDLDERLRRRLRQVRWNECKRYQTRRRNLRALGIPERAAREWAGSRKGYWRIAGSAVLNRALPTAYWNKLARSQPVSATLRSGYRLVSGMRASLSASCSAWRRWRQAEAA
jgi:RNA-directed DNA polymerase